ncbi:hypothetical protein D9M71_481440 [compost metagenome]
MRFEVVFLDQVPGQRLDPVRLDLGHHARIQLGGLDQFGSHHPLRALTPQARRRVYPEASLTGALVVAFFGLLADLAEQAAENGLVHLLVIGRFLVHRQLQVTADQRQLAMGIAPLTQAQVIEEILAAPVAQRVGRQRLALLFKATPQVDQRGEVGIHVLPLCVGLVGGLLALRRAFARVLH